MQKLLLLLVLPAMLLMFTACGDDDDDDVGENDLIGTWTSTGATLEFIINGQDLVQFLADTFGLSDTEKQRFTDVFETEFSGGFGGTITFEVDGTYSASFDGEPNSGEWTLNGDILTLISIMPGEDPVMLTVITLNSSSLVVQLLETESFLHLLFHLSNHFSGDFDDDGTNEELSIIVVSTFSKQ